MNAETFSLLNAHQPVEYLCCSQHVAHVAHVAHLELIDNAKHACESQMIAGISQGTAPDPHTDRQTDRQTDLLLLDAQTFPLESAYKSRIRDILSSYSVRVREEERCVEQIRARARDKKRKDDHKSGSGGQWTNTTANQLARR